MAIIEETFLFEASNIIKEKQYYSYTLYIILVHASDNVKC